MAKKKRKAKAKTKRKTAAKEPARIRAKGKKKEKGKDKDKRKKKKEAKAKSPKRIKPRTRAKTRGKGKLNAKTEPQIPDDTVSVTAPQVAPTFTLRRWKQVAGNLGLERHIDEVSRWDGQGTPPILTGFTFVRHVESDNRDLRCAGTSVGMTQGVIVRREDGRLILTGRGVTEKYLGIRLPRKSPADTGERHLSASERLELGQPEATKVVSDSSV